MIASSYADAMSSHFRPPTDSSHTTDVVLLHAPYFPIGANVRWEATNVLVKHADLNPGKRGSIITFCRSTLLTTASGDTASQSFTYSARASLAKIECSVDLAHVSHSSVHCPLVIPWRVFLTLTIGGSHTVLHLTMQNYYLERWVDVDMLYNQLSGASQHNSDASHWRSFHGRDRDGVVHAHVCGAKDTNDNS